MIKYAMNDMVKEVEHRFVKQWLRGVGKDAEFQDDSIGYYVVFKNCTASIYVGKEEPSLRAGDHVRLTVEKMHD